jgi:SAM-dependent methyltransferase
MDATAWDARYAGQELVWSKGPNVFVAEHAADLTPGRAIDLAGGEGRNAIWLAQQGWDVELVEFSQVALDKAAALADHAGVALERTLADVTVSPTIAPADLVVLAYLQLPPGPSRAAVRAAASLVAPGGTLLMVAHAKRNVTDGVGGPSDPEVNRSVEELCDDLAGTGLDVEVAREVTRPVATDEGRREAIDVLVRARRTAERP